MDKFEKLVEVFKDWNSKINLSAIRDDEWIKIKHIKDSLEGLKVIESLDINENKKDFNEWWNKNSNFSTLSSKFSIVDVWSWSGFPLLPLAISKPEWNFTWIESVRKKVNAISDMAEKLGLKNVNMIRTRAEDYKEKQFDILTARAVAYIDKLMKFTYHLVKPGGYFVLYKLNSPEEFKDLQKIAKKYKLKLVKTHKYKLFDDDIERVIYVLKKMRKD